MIQYGTTTILGKREFLAAINGLPARVVKKIMDEWSLKQARAVRNLARLSAPRDRRTPRRKPESARLWKSIAASQVKRLKKFKGAISRAIAYSKADRTRGRSRRAFQSANKFKPRVNSRSRKKAAMLGPAAPTARHFHLAVLGTVERRQKSTGRRTGSMPAHNFFSRAIAKVTNSAGGEVGVQLRDAYQKGIDAEIRRLARKYK